MALYNNGNIRMQVTNEELLAVWKTFFNKGLNWKDIEKNPTKYKKISDKRHINNIKKNPVHFLINSGKGLLVEKDGYAIAIREDLEPFITTSVCKQQIKDILEYRTLDYYRRRYKENETKAHLKCDYCFL